MNSQDALRLLGVLAAAAALLIGLLVIVGQGIPSLFFLLYFIIAPLLALITFLLPQKLTGPRLALIWSAGVLMATGGYLALMSIGFLVLPATVFILGSAFYLTLKSRPPLDWLLIFPAALLSWSAISAFMNFGTVRAISRPALVIAVSLIALGIIRRRLIQGWVVAAILAIILLPLLTQTISNYADFGQGGSFRRFEPMAKQIIYDHPKLTDKQLTKLFKDEAGKPLAPNEIFSASIKRIGKQAYSVSWQVSRQDEQSALSGGFFVGQPSTKKGPIRMELPPPNDSKE